MASFTDAITTFNPYVQQLPVEAMVKVGMQKQQQYDQGVEKIQAYIDNISGLEIANDADKKYVQSKLNSLGSNLASIAGADFSNQQLVTSVGGMANQIIKDEKVLNAVASTAHYKKQKSQLEKDYQAGKSSIANVKDFEKQASAWLLSDKPGQVFLGRYSPYIDIDKKWREIIKTISPNATTESFMYENYIGPDGKVQSDKLAAAMTKVTKEGVSAETIENAIRSSLTPDDINQIRIDANYRFDRVTPDELKVTATTDYDKSINYLNKVEKSLEGVANLSGSDPIRKQQALDTIEQIKTKKLSLKSQLQQSLELIDKDPEAVKINLYKEGAISSIAKAYSWEKKALEYLSNPALQSKFEQKRIDISERSLAETISQNSWSRTMDVKNLELNKAKYDLELEKLYGRQNGYTAYLGTGTANLKDPYSAISSDIANLEKSDIDAVAALASKIGMSPAALDASLDSWKIDPKIIGTQFRGEAMNILEARKAARIKKAELETAREKVFSDNPQLRMKDEQISQAVASKKPLGLTINGIKYTFSQRELFDFLAKEKTVYAGGGGAAGAYGSKSKAIRGISTNLLKPKEKILYDYMMGARYGDEKTAANSNQQFINNVLGQYQPLVNQHRQLQENITSSISRTLANSSGTYIPAISPIVTASAESKELYRGIADAALKTYNFPALGIKGGDALLSNDDAIKAQTWLTGEGKNDVMYGKLRYNDKTYLVLTKGGEDILVPLPAQQAAQLPKLKNEENTFDEAINRVQNSNKTGSTNPKGTISSAYYQSYNMPKLNRVVAVGDLQRNSSDPSLQYINLAVKTPSGFKHLQLDDYPMNASDADMYIRTLTDDKIKSLYLNSDKIPESWKEQIKNL
jgi:hypothetical protein